MKISITPVAALKLWTMKEKLGATAMLLGLQGGGCSGLKYIVRGASEAEVNDAFADGRIVWAQDMAFVIDKKSLPYLEGMTVDYKHTLMQSGFVFDNPSAAKTCGCGTSFMPK